MRHPRIAAALLYAAAPVAATVAALAGALTSTHAVPTHAPRHRAAAIADKCDIALYPSLPSAMKWPDCGGD